MVIVDLRSDTVTLPTPAMRKAMVEAELGDDVFGEDPTINRLQQKAAEMMGKESGLLVPSGTMGNLVAVLAHCGRGDEVMLGSLSHTYLFEAGGIAALGGVHPYCIPNLTDGTLDLAVVRGAVRADDPHFPKSRLLVLENTHNRCGGAVLSATYMAEAGKLAHSLGLMFHVDGARIFNAAAAQNVPARNLVKEADTVTFCLSKGLCAPVGSVLCGSNEFIYKARRIRKQLGGGMRQAGVLAAAGIVALDEMVDRLSEDHQRAQRLAIELQKVAGLELSFGMPQSNMVFINLKPEVPMTAAEAAKKLLALGVKVGVVAEKRFRLVTHYWITDEGVDQTIKAFRAIL